MNYFESLRSNFNEYQDSKQDALLNCTLQFLKLLNLNTLP